MKRKLLVGVLLLALSITAAGCGAATDTAQQSDAEVTQETAAAETEETEEEAEETQEASEEELIEEGLSLEEMEEIGEIPANEFESRVGKTTFESYDEIIDLLEGSEAYAYVDILGADEPILLVTDFTYDNLDGNRASIDATPYVKYADGTYRAGSGFCSGSTATPLAMTDDGCIIIATHSSVEKQCLGDNGTDTKAIMVMSYVYMNYGDDLTPDSYGGFIRDKNTVVDNDGVEIAEDDEQAYLDAFEEYDNSTVIDFTVKDPFTMLSSDDVIDAGDIAGSYVNFFAEDFGDGNGACIWDERLIINEDGTGIYSGDDRLSFTLEANAIKYEYEDSASDYFKYVDGCIVLEDADDGKICVYTKSSEDVKGTDEELDELRDEYMHPDQKDTKVEAGTYVSKYFEQYDDQSIVCSDWLVIDKDGSAKTMFQDYGPEFESIENGTAVTKDGEKLDCVVSKDCIAIKFADNDTYTIFVRTDEKAEF